MNISIVSVFPELYQSFLQTSLIKRAQQKGLVSFDVDAFFSYAQPKERIDGHSFGPGAGMLIKPEIVQAAIEQKERKHGPAFKIFFSPQGKKLDQRLLHKMAMILQEKKHMMLLPARYEGMDARVEEFYADEIISVGDFVVMGGDLPAMLFLEGMLRLVPDIVGKVESVERDSFYGPFVDYPEFTEPVTWQGLTVPDIVRSGNHAAIEKWRQNMAAEKSVMEHFDWVRSHTMNQQQKRLVASYIPSHYAALMHTDVLLPDGQVGTTSVTSIDIHDGARSSTTYGLKNYFIVTPLKDQQNIVGTLLDFWKTGPGKAYNIHRYQAVQAVELLNNLDEVIAAIEKKEGQKPLLIGTSALTERSKNLITYYDQAKVWEEKRPVLLIFGTGKGLSPALLDRCDFTLLPVEGFTDFNHLSVRSAMAIIFDRWLGINSKE
jgi:tRNA (guanine37-N1)-methyltransferase